ncbi:hypothetical protein SKAU_G00410300 [Synaphobranchus kaupii]|uniref:Uncharacterized protein n=1 Tax=Synaphobranchus kaupii TaxID=118154 RepID=A0A9Q1E7N8_SYNKA|nr:hypothetical protein SKAU_G00410300 [Synaphobranchus kaupii]
MAAAAAGPADAAELIDIYGEDDFNQNSGEDGDFVGRAEPSDLYDDVLTGSVSQDRLSREEATSSSKAQPTKPEEQASYPVQPTVAGGARGWPSMWETSPGEFEQELLTAIDFQV